MSEMNRTIPWKSRPNPSEHVQEAAKRRSQPCQDCGHVPEAGAAFCPLCGVLLDEPVETAAEALPPPAPAKSPVPARQPEPIEQDEPGQPQAELMEEAPDEAVAAAEPAGDPVACQCAEGLPGDAKFCVMCGSRIAQPVLRYRLSCSGPGGETSVEIPESGMVIGKAGDCDLVLSGDEYVSRRHAHLFLSDGQLLIEDLSSSNGTFLGIRKPVAVEAGDEVLIGRNILRIETVRK